MSAVRICKKWLTCRLAISEGGICKEGSGHWLQGKTNPGLLHHVLLTLKVNVHLHSKGSLTGGGSIKIGIRQQEAGSG